MVIIRSALFFLKKKKIRTVNSGSWLQTPNLKMSYVWVWDPLYVIPNTIVLGQILLMAVIRALVFTGTLTTLLSKSSLDIRKLNCHSETKIMSVALQQLCFYQQWISRKFSWKIFFVDKTSSDLSMGWGAIKLTLWFALKCLRQWMIRPQ